MATHKKTSRRQQPASVFVPGTDPLAFAPPAVTTLAAQLAGFVAEPQGYDPELAEELIAAYRPRLTAITPDRLDVPRVDLVKPLYAEVQELGLRFLRYDPRREARFPSLYVVGRAGQGRKRTKREAGAPRGGDATPGAEDGATPGAGSGAGAETAPATGGTETPAPV